MDKQTDNIVADSEVKSNISITQIVRSFFDENKKLLGMLGSVILLLFIVSIIILFVPNKPENGLETYRNNHFNFSFNYPATTKIEQTGFEFTEPAELLGNAPVLYPNEINTVNRKTGDHLWSMHSYATTISNTFDAVERMIEIGAGNFGETAYSERRITGTKQWGNKEAVVVNTVFDTNTKTYNLKTMYLVHESWDGPYLYEYSFNEDASEEEKSRLNSFYFFTKYEGLKKIVDVGEINNKPDKLLFARHISSGVCDYGEGCVYTQGVYHDGVVKGGREKYKKIGQVSPHEFSRLLRELTTYLEFGTPCDELEYTDLHVLYTINIGEITKSPENCVELSAPEFAYTYTPEYENLIDTSKWVTYQNEKYGFEFRYPHEWSYSVFDNKEFGIEIKINKSDGSYTQYYEGGQIEPLTIIARTLWENEKQTKEILEKESSSGLIKDIEIDGEKAFYNSTSLSESVYVYHDNFLYSISIQNFLKEKIIYDVYNGILESFNFIQAVPPDKGL